ncbi:SET and MYND domain-containing protein (SMYD)-like protein [Dinothrombium tinctorium]|uniref:SET and MYND domain-containing protein (SMYD)-like protein n=1 Tax=Dinothrombium tinctorium TaxID=1965070 RepID=A0A3S3Q1Y3_9ACAR|nr:SET and MYND domain-containing protein (SMYD)-like protein [Dinothrombium tinctorium]RWS12374.1 SET and MYND domain-containing protein (SMYD)-like protein [Dinothrombium tinctorium]
MNSSDERLKKMKLCEKLAKQTLKTYNGSQFRKSDLKASELRKKGNEYFAKRQFEQALNFYTEATINAAFPNTNHSSHELCFAFANRSAVFFHQNDYENCLKDIQIAFEFDYPLENREKLVKRKAMCEQKLKEKRNSNFGTFKDDNGDECNEFKSDKIEAFVCSDEQKGIQAIDEIFEGDEVLIEKPRQTKHATNEFLMQLEEFDIGCAVYLQSRLFNHSCKPNVEISHFDGSPVCKALLCNSCNGAVVEDSQQMKCIKCGLINHIDIEEILHTAKVCFKRIDICSELLTKNECDINLEAVKDGLIKSLKCLSHLLYPQHKQIANIFDKLRLCAKKANAHEEEVYYSKSNYEIVAANEDTISTFNALVKLIDSQRNFVEASNNECEIEKQRIKRKQDGEKREHVHNQLSANVQNAMRYLQILLSRKCETVNKCNAYTKIVVVIHQSIKEQQEEYEQK